MTLIVETRSVLLKADQNGVIRIGETRITLDNGSLLE